MASFLNDCEVLFFVVFVLFCFVLNKKTQILMIIRELKSKCDMQNEHVHLCIRNYRLFLPFFFSLVATFCCILSLTNVIMKINPFKNDLKVIHMV